MDTSELLTEDSDWHLTVSGFEPAREHGVETLLTIANGYAGTRGALEEGSPASRIGTYLAGVFDPVHQTPDPPRELSETPCLVRAPDWLGLIFELDGERLTLEHGQVLAHERILDLCQGVMVRRWHHRLPSGRILQLLTFRCLSLSDRHVFLQRAWITLEGRSVRVRLAATLDGRKAEAFEPCPRTGAVGEHENPPALLDLHTARSGIVLAMAQSCSLSEEGGALPDRQWRTVESRGVTDGWEWQAEPGHTYVLDRTVAVYTSREVSDPAAYALKHAPTMHHRGIDQELQEHRARWAERWRAADVRIIGDPVAQRAMRFALYHLMAATHPEDEHVSIGARALSGEAYCGHVFWDTEIYMLPFFIFTWPDAARTLLMYRYHTLDAARAKAADQGYRGALYAWESAASGHEATASTARGPEGKVIPIFTGKRAHHISADIAYALWQYWRATGDHGFFIHSGAEIVLETARFWASRARREPDGHYHIRGVVGPDEYHEQVDDSAYTNTMARFNLELGRESAVWLQQYHPREWQALRERLGLSEDELEDWRGVAEHLVDGHDPRTNYIEEFAGYFGLKDLDLRDYEPRAAAMQVMLGREQTARTQVIKQADVVLLCHLLWERYTPEVIAKNFDYYEPRCDHASSLSPSIHALVAARLGRLELARRYFDQAAAIDLEDDMGNAALGVHVGACGGLWQAIVFGMAGMQLLADGLAFDPHLLPGWQALHFSVQWRGRLLGVSLRSEPPQAELWLAEDAESIWVRLGQGARQRLQPGEVIMLAQDDRA
jgi:trehalose/maltose hydrolase-like predicted phosphorylase